MKRARLPLAIAALLAVSCGSGDAEAPAPSVGVTSGPTAKGSGGAAPKLTPRAACPEAEVELERGSFDHTRSSLIASAEPHHFAVDAVAKQGAPARLRAKFSYGSTGKDLEDETIVFFAEDASCKAREVGRAKTDDDGWAVLDVPAAKVSVGPQSFTAIVLGDGTRSKATLWVVAPGTKAVVFDVDATLTTSDREIVEEVVKGYVPDMRPDGPKVVKAYADAGFFVGYVTGRPYLLLRKTTAWLKDKGFPAGFVRVTDHTHEAVPSESGVQAYKIRALEELKSAGLSLTQAYGNATTDICAYARAGVPMAKTFILGPHAGKACDGFANTVALDSYTAQVPKLPALLATP